MPNIPELLAPAGGIQQLKAAVENGADAVYLGGKLFNARINAGNFDDETMKEALAYAHLRNVKIYVTMNILIKDDELEEALQYAKKLYEFGVDALIIQDLGFARMLRRRLPSMKIHLSTQGTVYNPSGVKMAKSLGFERVVLAREVTLDEIKEITKENLLEIEVFVHGALCICYSGQCQMSRVLGGRSGNRGMCAQPCRLEFIADDKKQGNHLLSPKDLCSVDFLGELAEAGIASLKIEGRMKSPEYVAIVTRIYRKYLDEYQRNGCYKVEKEDREKLTQIFNRGSFTSGYLKGDPEEELMSADIPKHQGVYIGKVTASAQRDLIDIQLEGKLSIGDGVEIRNKYMPGNVVTYLKPVKDKIVRIGDIKGKVWPNDPVYKITDKALMLEARESFEGQSSSQMQYYRKAEVTAFFQALLHKKPVLFINDGAITVRVEGETAVERAIKRSLTEEDIAKQLNKTGEVPFRILNICFEVEEGIALPMSVINQMRREAFNQLIHEKTKVRKLSPDETDLFYELTPNNAGEQKNGERKEKTEEEIQVELYFHTMEHVNKKTIDFVCKILTEEELSVENMRLYVPLYEYIENQNDKLLRFIQTIKEQYKIKVIPYLPNVTKGAYDSYIVINFDKIISICRDTGISIGNLGWISEFQKSGVQVYGDYGLNIYNREAVSWCRDIKMIDYISSHEVYNDRAARAQEIDCDFVGAVPLMISEHFFSNKEFLDRKNKRFIFIKNSFENKSIIVQKMSNVENSIREKIVKKRCKKLRIYIE